MEERIAIIDTFKTRVGFEKQPIEKRQRHLTFLVWLDILILLPSLIMLIVAAYSSLIRGLDWTWNSTGMALLVLLCLNGFLSSASIYLEWRLLKHLAYLRQATKPLELNQENARLRAWLTKKQSLGSSRWQKLLLVVIALVLMVLTIWQMLPDSNNFIWPYLQWPLTLGVWAFVVYFLKLFFSLRRLLIPVEQSIKTN